MLNWGSAPLTATLRDVVTFALQPGALPRPVQRQLKTALRAAFQLPPKTEGERLLAPCSGVSAEDLYDFPKRVYTAARATSSKATAENLRGAVRRAMRLAANEDRVPVIFPRAWEDDPWELAAWRYFSDDAPGILPATVAVYRSNWRDYAREAKALFAAAPYRLEPVLPEMIDAQMLQTLKKHLIEVKGKRYLAAQIGTVLSYIARHHGVGPLVAKWSSGREETYRGRFNAGYLVDSTGRAHTGSVDGFLKILGDGGFGPEFIEFFDWYFRYSTLPDDVLERHPDEYPERPAHRSLKQRTVEKRLIGLRAWLYQAVATLQVEAKDLTLEAAFGTHYRRVQSAVLHWWARRAEDAEVSDASSSGVETILKAAGMVARALYDRSRHLRGLSVVGADGSALTCIDEESTSKTSREEAWWRAYRTAMARIDTLKGRRATSADGHVHTTLKSIKRMVEQTPYTYWETLHAECLRRIEASRAEGVDSLRYHRLVTMTFTLGILMSTGLRIAELTHLRYGTARVDHYRGQYDRESLRPQRRIMLRPVDRKNERRHSAFLRERYCPQWLEREYEERSRPWLMARGSQEHDWVLVDARGRPYGCQEEDERGGGRDDLAHSTRVADLRSSWQDILMPIAASIGLTIPTGWGEFAPHAVRGVFGHAIFQALGTVAAANYLGDATASVEDTYATVDGANINVAEVLKGEFGTLAGALSDDARVGADSMYPGRGGTRHRSNARVQAPDCSPSPTYHEEMMALLDRAERHQLDPTTVDRMVASLNAKHGIAV